MKILLDTRESEETKDILLFFLNAEEKMLPVGDIVIDDILCFEHKTPDDFIGSVFDGRLFRQIAEMNDNYPQSYVVVSGSMTDLLQLAESINRYSSIVAAIGSCFARGSPVIFCDTLINLADIVKVLGKKMTDGKSRDHPIQKTKMSDLRLQFICALPGVSEQKGKDMLEKFGSVSGVINATSDELQTVYKVGEKTAKGIRDVLEG